MGAQASAVEGVHVVVVGGGFGGVAAARQLQAAGLSFTLIDIRDCFHHNVAALRAAVLPGLAERTFIPYADTFGDSFVQGRVERVDVDRQTVVLDDGTEVGFSHLVLSTGSDGALPGRFNSAASRQSAVQEYQHFITQLQAADSLLVVGGGSSGVEMAAEIKSEYPEKKVVLIHSRAALADPELLPSVRQQAKQLLLQRGVELRLGEKVCDLSALQLNVTQKNSVVTTERGDKLTTDLIVCCTGLKINTTAYASSFSGCMAENGALKVNDHLQVEGFSNVFAIGDCANVNEPKMAYHAELHAAVAVTNIINSLRGKELTSYLTGNITMLLAMGRDDGVGQFNGFRLPRWLVVLGKSRDLLLWKSWREMRQKQP
ncbi:ferroptosis suppressor protein 1-like [Centropristis striata]|uniref:ferroptosis suppressor protein 1-like n=1 Tax=Centropristis striata TaxID=184440 RepID=UPI0027DFEA29|nr:ferroptosis suppressor protein 1-like [Centropristis striata]